MGQVERCIICFHLKLQIVVDGSLTIQFGHMTKGWGALSGQVFGEQKAIWSEQRRLSEERTNGSLEQTTEGDRCPDLWMAAQLS